MSASDATSYYIAGSNAAQTVDDKAYTFSGISPLYPMNIIRGAVGTCDPTFVTATGFSGFSYYGTVIYSFANCTTGDQVLFLDQTLGAKSGGAPVLTIDTATC